MGEVLLASRHMPFVGHSIQIVVVLGGVPFRVPQVCFPIRLLSPRHVWPSWHTSQCSLPRMNRRSLSHLCPACYISFLAHGCSSICGEHHFVLGNKMGFEFHPLLVDGQVLEVPSSGGVFIYPTCFGELDQPMGA